MNVVPFLKTISFENYYSQHIGTKVLGLSPVSEACSRLIWFPTVFSLPFQLNRIKYTSNRLLTVRKMPFSLNPALTGGSLWNEPEVAV